MSKLTPPALQNLTKRKAFFLTHSDHPNAEEELMRINTLEQSKKQKALMRNFSVSIKKHKLGNLKKFTKGAFGKLPDYLIKYQELEPVI